VLAWPFEVGLEEACGRIVATYSLDVALALHRTRGVTAMVANPRAIKQFTGALRQRSKTDLTAAVALRDDAIRMPFVAWVPPASHVLELRGIARRIAALCEHRLGAVGAVRDATPRERGVPLSSPLLVRIAG
jgi:transposase